MKNVLTKVVSVSSKSQKPLMTFKRATRGCNGSGVVPKLHNASLGVMERVTSTRAEVTAVVVSTRGHVDSNTVPLHCFHSQLDLPFQRGRTCRSVFFASVRPTSASNISDVASRDSRSMRDRRLEPTPSSSASRVSAACSFRITLLSSRAPPRSCNETSKLFCCNDVDCIDRRCIPGISVDAATIPAITPPRSMVPPADWICTDGARGGQIHPSVRHSWDTEAKS